MSGPGVLPGGLSAGASAEVETPALLPPAGETPALLGSAVADARARFAAFFSRRLWAWNVSLLNFSRGSLCSPPGRQLRPRCFASAASFAALSESSRARFDSSGESHTFPRANHFISALGVFFRS
jgi:hypothetical protein